MNSRHIIRSTARLKRPLTRAIGRNLFALAATNPLLASNTDLKDVPSWSRQDGRWFSSESTSTNDNNKAFPTAMRNMVKPFFMKCHPDVQTIESAKERNLQAIQNLNAFMDAMELRLTTKSTQVKPNEKTVFEVDFCILVEERIKGKPEEILCRRKVELKVPTDLVKTTTVESKRKYQTDVENQLIKLLHIAGLKSLERESYEQVSNLEEKVRRDWDEAVKTNDFSKLDRDEVSQARKEKYERSREEFMSRVDWKRYKQIYREHVEDIAADSLTSDLIRDNPRQRMAYLAEILSRVRIQENNEEGDEEEGEATVDPISQLIALRRLSLILDDNFDELSLENLGRMWDSATIVLTAPRDYNTSPTALYRRRKRKTKGDVMANDGFAFALHHDNSVTIHIPVDFRDDELLSQLKRHVKDYNELFNVGLEALFPKLAGE